MRKEKNNFADQAFEFDADLTKNWLIIEAFSEIFAFWRFADLSL
jgi:hypothetical protein